MPNKLETLLVLMFFMPIPIFTIKIWLLRRTWDGIPFIHLPAGKIVRTRVGMALLCLLPVGWMLLLAFVIDPHGISRMAQAILTIALLADVFCLYLWFSYRKISRTAEVWIKPEILDCLMIRDKNGQYAISLKDAEIKVTRPLYSPAGRQVINYHIKAGDVALNLAIPWESTMGVDIRYMDSAERFGGLVARGSGGKIVNLHRLLQGFAF